MQLSWTLYSNRYSTFADTDDACIFLCQHMHDHGFSCCDVWTWRHNRENAQFLFLTRYLIHSRSDGLHRLICSQSAFSILANVSCPQTAVSSVVLLLRVENPLDSLIVKQETERELRWYHFHSVVVKRIGL